MGIREKLHLFKNKDNAEENSSKAAARKCVLKVQDKFRLRNTDDIVVVGELKGKIQVGDAVYMSNFSDDDGEILVTVVLGIEVGQGKTVREAENDEQLSREPRPLPVMRLNPDVKSLFDFRYGDFTLEGYDPWPAIKAPMSF